LEINREQAVSKAPFFLAECRRRIFAAAYHWDKLLATLFDRPPRIPSYYADCCLPLELTDDQLCLDVLSVEKQASLEHTGGWHDTGPNYSASWIRALYLLAQFKEETLLHQLKPLNEETKSKLQSVQYSRFRWSGTQQRYVKLTIIAGISPIGAKRRGTVSPIVFIMSLDVGSPIKCPSHASDWQKSISRTCRHYFISIA
jgi:hypothetical protein